MTLPPTAPEAEAVRWYAVMTAPRAEEKAARNLRRCGFRVFYPYEAALPIPPKHARQPFLRARRRKEALRDRPYYPRYIFVGLRPGEGFNARSEELYGVSTIVYCGQKTSVIPQAAMDKLFAKCAPDGRVKPEEAKKPRPFLVDEIVEIASGPFEGQCGSILSVDGARKARILIAGFNGRVEAVVSLEDIAFTAPEAA